MGAHCYQRFNRIEIHLTQSKTDGQLCFLLDCYDAPTKQNEIQTHKQMKLRIDEKDGGLWFCSLKKSYKNMVIFYQKSETTRRKKGQVCAETRVKSLKQHLQVFKQHKERNSTQYWKIYDDNNVQIIKTKALTAVLFLFEIKGA